MHIKRLFTVAEGEKVTEKVFARVLLSSVCSMLLCMACLAGTTWAWFTTSVENTGNVIQIGTAWATMQVVSVNGEAPVSGVILLDGLDNNEDGKGLSLPAGEDGTYVEYVLHVANANAPDDLDKKSTLYVTLIASGELSTGETATSYGYVVLDENNGYETDVTIRVGQTCTLSLGVSWFAPAGADPLDQKGDGLDDSQGDILIYPVIEEKEEPTTVESGTEGTPVETTAEETSAEETDTEGTDAVDADLVETTAEQPSAEETTAEQTSAEETTAEQISAEETTTEQPSAVETSAEETSAEETSAEETSAEGAGEAAPENA